MRTLLKDHTSTCISTQTNTAQTCITHINKIITHTRTDAMKQNEMQQQQPNKTHTIYTAQQTKIRLI